MTRRLSRIEVAKMGITQPVPLGFAVRQDALPKDRLSLTELVLIRRLQSGMSATEAGKSLQMSKTAVNNAIKRATRRFGVETKDELYALPHVIEQLNEEG